MPLAAFPKAYVGSILIERSMTLDDWIGIAGRLDLDGVEMYSPMISGHGDAELAQLRRRASDHGLAIPMMCHSSDFTFTDTRARRLQIDRQKRVIHQTAKLGGDLCRVLSGQDRRALSRASGIALAAQSIRELIPFAADHGVRLILENHYKDDGWESPEFARRAEVFLELLDEIPPSTWFGVNFDPSNALVVGDDPIALLERVKHRILSMHASDRHLQEGHTPSPGQDQYSSFEHGVIGEGANDYDAIFAILRSVEFAGWISIEDGNDPVNGEANLRKSAAFLRRKMALHGLA
jgi:sugar phosphate isomerase/epimerase